MYGRTTAVAPSAKTRELGLQTVTDWTVVFIQLKTLSQWTKNYVKSK